MKRAFIIILSLFSLNAPAQNNPSHPDANTGFIDVTADARLSMLVNKGGYKDKSALVGAGMDNNGGNAGPYRTKGVRIQIYSGPDRAKANQTKMSFMKNFPGIRAYLMYSAPNFRVRVGDFKSRSDAMELYQQLTGTYKAAMIVPDMVTILSLKKQND